jgi:hypothetical protein
VKIKLEYRDGTEQFTIQQVIDQAKFEAIEAKDSIVLRKLFELVINAFGSGQTLIALISHIAQQGYVLEEYDDDAD